MVQDLFYKILHLIDVKALIIIACFAIAVFFFLKIFIISILIIATLAVSFLFSKLRVKSLGIELVTFTTVLIGYSYGPGIGMLVGVFLILFHVIIAKYIGSYLLWTFPKYIIIGYLAAVLSFMSIQNIGLLIVVIFNIIYMFLALIFFKDSIVKQLIWISTNIVFNVLLFLFVGPIVIGFVG